MGMKPYVVVDRSQARYHLADESSRLIAFGWQNVFREKFIFIIFLLA